MTRDYYDLLLNVIKMKPNDEHISSKNKADYTCMLCGTIHKYTAKQLVQRYKKYKSVGCTDCNKKHNRSILLNDIRCKLNDYEFITNLEDTVNVAKDKVTLRNKKCNHTFTSRLGDILYKNVTCPECAKIALKSQTSIRKRRDGLQYKKENYTYKQIENMFYEKNLNSNAPILIKDITTYTGMNNKMVFVCGVCSLEWSSRPANILHLNSGCPQCAKTNYSKKSIQWLDSLSKELNCNIQHAENGGEKLVYAASGKRYFVDGFCAELNTVYEFNGSRYHGDPNVYENNETPHPYKKDITAGELLQKTLDKENDLKNSGYTVVSIWESDYNKQFNKL